MVQNIVRAKRSEKGRLTPENCVVVGCVDVRPQWEQRGHQPRRQQNCRQAVKVNDGTTCFD